MTNALTLSRPPNAALMNFAGGEIRSSFLAGNLVDAAKMVHISWKCPMNTSAPLILFLIVSLMVLANVDASEGRSFKAIDYARKTIYHSPEKPGFTSWVGAW